jgi:hypothetical protein
MNTLISDMEDYSRILSADYKLQQQLKIQRDSIEMTLNYWKIEAQRTSMADYKKEDWLINLPLYAIGSILNLHGK